MFVVVGDYVLCRYVLTTRMSNVGPLNSVWHYIYELCTRPGIKTDVREYAIGSFFLYDSLLSAKVMVNWGYTWVSSVILVTRLLAARPDIRQCVWFFCPQSSDRICGTGIFLSRHDRRSLPRHKRPDVKYSTHFHLEPKIRMRGSPPPFLHSCSWHCAGLSTSHLRLKKTDRE